MDGFGPGAPTDADRPTRLRRAVVRTVAYADLFDFPLLTEEVWRQLLFEKADLAEISGLLDGLDRDPFLAERLQREGPYVSLRGRVGLAAQRATRQSAAEALIAKHRRVLGILPLLPWLRMAAFSGGTSRRNSIQEDDLDLFIVTAPGHAWSVFVGLVLLGHTAGCREVLCANYIVDGTNLQVPDGGDFFTGQEMLGLEPLHGRRQLERMREINDWAGRLLPNADLRPDLPLFRQAGLRGGAQRSVELLLWPAGWAIERAARLGLGWYLGRKRQEGGDMLLRAGILKLHRSDNRLRVVDRYRERLIALGVAGDDLESLLQPRRRR